MPRHTFGCLATRKFMVIYAKKSNIIRFASARLFRWKIGGTFQNLSEIEAFLDFLWIFLVDENMCQSYFFDFLETLHPKRYCKIMSFDTLFDLFCENRSLKMLTLGGAPPPAKW